MAKKRRSFSREFKIEAVKLVTQQGQSIAEARHGSGVQWWAKHPWARWPRGRRTIGAP